MKKFFRALSAALCLAFCPAFCPAAPVAHAETPPLLYDADLRFVDAVGGVGYYVDMNSAAVSGGSADALVAVLDADDDKLYLYQINFQLKTRQYTVKNVILFRYEDKRELKSMARTLDPLPYAPGSPLESIALYIENPRP